MTMQDMENEIPEIEIVKKPKPLRKKQKRKAVKRTVAALGQAPVTAGPFAGLTVTDCCNACSVSGCVISGKPYCAHPRKGGLHSGEIQDPAALKRLQRTKRILGEQMLEARGE
jgi:hypothetical protein